MATAYLAASSATAVGSAAAACRATSLATAYLAASTTEGRAAAFLVASSAGADLGKVAIAEGDIQAAACRVASLVAVRDRAAAAAAWVVNRGTVPEATEGNLEVVVGRSQEEDLASPSFL